MNVFFFNDTATTEIYTLSLHDALPIWLAAAISGVNAIAPAVIATPMNENAAPEVLDYMLSKIPMGRIGEAAEVAVLVSWLCSDRCSSSTDRKSTRLKSSHTSTSDAAFCLKKKTQ